MSLQSVREEAIRTVKSARVGDQNALDTLRQMGINAGKGNPAAIEARKYVSDWILANPVPGAVKPSSTMGAEASSACGALMTCDAWQAPSWLSDVGARGGDVGFCTAVHILSRRALLSPELVQEMALGLEEGPRKLFWWGVATCCYSGPADAILDKQGPDVKGIALAGKAVGRARKVQQVIAGAPISVLNRQAGIEHGE
jgi:hypothetical protein